MTDSQATSVSSYPEYTSDIPSAVIERITEARDSNRRALDLSGFHLDYLPSELFELKFLESLDVSSNNLKMISPKISNLSGLRQLNLANNYINNLPYTIGNLKELECLNVCNNPLIDLPSDVQKKGCKGVLNYFKDFQQSYSAWGDVKLIFLGDNNAGKSSLVWSLINHKKKSFFSTFGRRKSVNSAFVNVHTDSIDVLPWCTENFNFAIWDFAGADIYYDICDCFLSERTCYVVVFNMSVQNRDHEIQYWLDLVKDKTQSPIVLVGTHLECISKAEYQRISQMIHQQFPNMSFFGVNNKNYKGIDEVGKHLKTAAQQILRQSVPSTFLTIKDSLSTIRFNGKKFMTRREFSGLAQDFNIGEKEVECLRYLHDSGAIIFVGNAATDPDQSFLILDPSYIVDAWSAVITSKQLIHDGIVLVEELAAKTWPVLSFPQETHPYLINTFINFRKLEAATFNDKPCLVISPSIRHNHGHRS